MMVMMYYNVYVHACTQLTSSVTLPVATAKWCILCTKRLLTPSCDNFQLWDRNKNYSPLSGHLCCLETPARSLGLSLVLPLCLCTPKYFSRGSCHR